MRPHRAAHRLVPRRLQSVLTKVSHRVLLTACAHIDVPRCACYSPTRCRGVSRRPKAVPSCDNAVSSVVPSCDHLSYATDRFLPIYRVFTQTREASTTSTAMDWKFVCFDLILILSHEKSTNLT